MHTNRLSDRDLDAFYIKTFPGYQSVYSNRMQLTTFKPGTFSGFPLLEWQGPCQYLLKPNTPDFYFTRWNGEIVKPASIITDGGSIPQLFWNLPGFNPWTYMPAYILHDWLFYLNRTSKQVTNFMDDNLILAEAMMTLSHTGFVEDSPLRIRIVYNAVSLFGKQYWKVSNVK